MDIFIKILQNNVVEKEIKFHVFDTFLRLMPVKSESLKISLETNIIYVDQYFFFATQHFYYSGITLSNKKMNFSKLLINLIGCGTQHRYSIVILVFTFH